jgi:hypoxanthine-guanine phosphoribosyltransferase
MVGSISFYDKQGDRLNSIYVAQPPKYGKESFYTLLKKEIEQVKKDYEDKTFIGVADGAVDNWSFLQPFVEEQILDFFHASEYHTQKYQKQPIKTATQRING